ncbi:hypothetical protein A3C91_02630 [Candidatus Azambacteria bacterium RIFCSPHIGHO2_02_FULL_52_12]|uniref:Uncharacterized protein n=1 Tax=Candidatus Azambacteria bacterium RIFCSPLOWO2_01_FULL_46_25 TaxID=1797298 RepID=A0A1F5BTI2_9BACT|nr:MAG: hypothetical protein A3C91_02630 [Candidatus Azambacteria bacterium RIFCSPHIGHO2_02_FULL_52_12]OGD33927.1 MAG: hypothetical protein A2988_00335 [Candidatus Azambacteria bacterium RIFCSPLOWO2_01_FULL_46_25]OGD37732.1 MAG: hypothetical protein A2850_04355 [Candidatus Azambacteria bacterium RIFCSPHIGHO2_01_FULL_51_74]
MDDDFEKFNTDNNNEPPSGLLNAVMARIERERRQTARKKRIVLFSLCAIGSLLAITPTSKALVADISQSGFAHFLSLAFSDPGMVLASWNDFALSILESLPALSMAAFLLTIFAFLGSVRLLARDITMVFIQPRLIRNN